MEIEIKNFRSGKNASFCFVFIGGKCRVEEFILQLKKKNRASYTKLLAFIDKICESGIELWKGNDEKYKRLEKYKGSTIWELKQWGIRIFDIEKEKNLILLDACEKKQNKMSKKNRESLKRSKSILDTLIREGVINGLG